MDRAAERPVSAGPMVGINSRCSTRIRSEIMSVGAAQTLLLVVTHLRGVRPLSSGSRPTPIEDITVESWRADIDLI
jgi:hypothetical protein